MANINKNAFTKEQIDKAIVCQIADELDDNVLTKAVGGNACCAKM